VHGILLWAFRLNRYSPLAQRRGKAYAYGLSVQDCAEVCRGCENVCLGRTKDSWVTGTVLARVQLDCNGPGQVRIHAAVGSAC
jgi:hypothetical protein